MSHFTGIIGIAAILGACYAFSTDRKAIRWKIVGWGLLLQVFFAVIVLKFDFGQKCLAAAGEAVTGLLNCTRAGSGFVFGDLAAPDRQPAIVFAFYVLPTIIFMAAFFAVLYHFGIMQVIIKAAAGLMTRLMGVSGAESLDVAASIFMGQSEAPLTIRPFLPKLTQSELMTVMTAGMAHVSGGIMGAYIALGHVEAKHLLGAVIMTAPGTLLIAKTLVPETETPLSGSKVEFAGIDDDKKRNFLGAIAHGTTDGLGLALTVAAMLISFLALIALVNVLMGWVHAHALWFPENLQVIMGWLFAPIAWLIGVPWENAKDFGSLLGIRMIGNEVIAFQQLGPMKDHLDPRIFAMATYALCGFANLSSIGIQIGGIGALAPNRRNDLAKLGFRAMLAGTAANLISAAIVGMLV
jgi:CNT family concentrative nucleoside transporter